jgi:hypothetical protein
MYKIIISSHVDACIDRYGNMYRDVFLSRFSDTGLWQAETVIQQHYIEASDLLVDSLYDAIDTKICLDILWYSLLENGLRETSIKLGMRRLFLTYEEDTENMIRYITDIEILRR